MHSSTASSQKPDRGAPLLIWNNGCSQVHLSGERCTRKVCMQGVLGKWKANELSTAQLAEELSIRVWISIASIRTRLNGWHRTRLQS